MIVVWISHKNRRERRAAIARARKAGLQLLIVRAEGDVHDQTCRLMIYLLNPDPHNLASLLEHGDLPPELLKYMTGKKTGPKGLRTPANLDAADVPESEDSLEREPSNEGPDIELLKAALNTVRHQPNSERVLQIVTRNLFTQTLEDQQLELSLIAGLAPGEDSPVEHVVVSWPDGVKPTLEQVEELINLLLKTWRMERHQLFATVHGDTEHIHVHIAVNRVDPLTGERVPFGGDEAWALDTLHQSIAVAAHRFDWPTAENARYHADQAGCHDRASGIKVLDAKLAPCASRSDWRRINEIRQREERDQAVSSEALRYELRTGYLSLERIAREQLADVFKEAVTWAGVHGELANRGVEYVLSPSGKGAQLVFAGRAIPASRAWGGASLDKLSKQVGVPFEPRANDVDVAPFLEQEYAQLRAAVLRRQKLTSMRAQAQFEKAVTVDVSASIAAVHDAARDAIDAKCWIGRRDAMNAMRSVTAKRFRLAREALSAEIKRRRRDRKLRRRLLKLREWREPFTNIADSAKPLGLMFGADFGNGRQVHVVDPELDRTEFEDRCEFRRNGCLVFVDRLTIIDLHAQRDEHAMRAAMRLAHAKWGSVQLSGNAELLSMLVNISLEENIVVTNRALQPLLDARRRERDEIEQRRRAFEADAVPAAELTQTRDISACPPTKPRPSLPAEYPEPFHRWDQLDRAEDNARDAAADSIVRDQKLLSALEELRAQGFPQASRIKAGARHFARTPVTESAGLTHLTPQTDPPIPSKPAISPTQSLQKLAKAQADRERDELLKTYSVLRQVALSRTGWVESPFRANAEAVLKDVGTRPNAYRVVDNPPGVVMADRSPSGRSDELAVMSFDREFMARARSMLRKAETYSGVGRLPALLDLPPTVKPRPQDEFLARLATQTLIPKLVDQRPRILKNGGAYWFADVRLTESMGDDAVALLTNAGQSQLKAAFLLQQIDRLDLFSAVSEGRATIETEADDNGRTKNRLTHGDADNDQSLSRFASDAVFALDATLAASTPRPPSTEGKRHALLRTYQLAADEGDTGAALALCGMIERDADKNKILRQIGDGDVRRLDSLKAHERELRRIWMASKPRREKPRSDGKAVPRQARSHG
jgi:Relaxase/Mobilisation nuclease domain/Large polyvalent protein-associated domain 7